MRIPAGASLTTGANTRIDLALLPGALLRLDPDTEIRFEKLRVAKNGTRAQEAMQRETSITLVRGALNASLECEVESARFRVFTPRGILSTTSSAAGRFEVTNNKTRLTCARGSFWFEASDGRTPVSVESVCVREWPPSGAEAIPADFDLRATQEMEKFRQVEQKLLELEDRTKLSPYPWRP